jgi:hypothetical protein
MEALGADAHGLLLSRALARPRGAGSAPPPLADVPPGRIHSAREARRQAVLPRFLAEKGARPAAPLVRGGSPLPGHLSLLGRGAASPDAGDGAGYAT